MNLVTRFLAARRDKLLMKLGCWLVIFSLVLGLMLPQQRAEALVAELTIGSVAALAASYLCACGLPLVTQGMDRDALVSNVQRLIQEFLDTELGGISIQDWLVGVWDLVFTGGKLVLSRMLTDKLMEFAQWVAGKYGVQVGPNIVYENLGKYPEIILPGSNITLHYPFSLTYNSEFTANIVLDRSFYIAEPGDYVIFKPELKEIPFGAYFYCANIRLGDSGYVDLRREYDENGLYLYFSVTERSLSSGKPYVGFEIRWAGESYTVSAGSSFPLSLFSYLAYANVVPKSLSIERKREALIFAPPTLAAEQGIALDVGATATMDLDQVLQGVLDSVLEGTLTSIMEAAGEAVVDPPAEEIPDVDGLGLPALGQALTSRFPFSIPWDFFRAIKLLAAPAKAPYFEVDFMEPLADEVGGWNGSTKVVLDFGEYAIIGQISRWTSTIGFCLMLAGATKRLIWTA